jgi:geranylgeranyl pyrophosphate synthase
VSFAGLLDGFREKLDRELDAWLAARRAAAGGFREAAELVDGVRQLVLQGGKRLRPALVYYTYRACGGPSDAEVLPLALAVELLHTYLLIHDDIMDHAEVRRGQPSAHERFRQLHLARGFALTICKSRRDYPGSTPGGDALNARPKVLPETCCCSGPHVASCQE